MKIESFSVGNAVYDEVQKKEILITVQTLLLMNDPEHRDRIKPILATPKSIRRIGFQQMQSKDPKILIFTSPKAENGFQLVYKYSEVELSGIVLMFNNFFVPIRYLHQIQNLFFLFGEERLEYEFKEGKIKQFKI